MSQNGVQWSPITNIHTDEANKSMLKKLSQTIFFEIIMKSPRGVSSGTLAVGGGRYSAEVGGRDLRPHWLTRPRPAAELLLKTPPDLYQTYFMCTAPATSETTVFFFFLY
ncbi:hypothetical protein EVAR_92606_1 [Eumeta japonica]|uniref:Uncharacterized protein n=1 Tax=Eumeta variegata TaxID=151549 RepID=A0A4C1SWS3_EUMVA|nr:hypothetical protein EVAR_92606_1 [Eumeta japonica]